MVLDMISIGPAWPRAVALQDGPGRWLCASAHAPQARQECQGIAAGPHTPGGREEASHLAWLL